MLRERARPKLTPTRCDPSPHLLAFHTGMANQQGKEEKKQNEHCCTEGFCLGCQLKTDCLQAHETATCLLSVFQCQNEDSKSSRCKLYTLADSDLVVFARK